MRPTMPMGWRSIIPGIGWSALDRVRPCWRTRPLRSRWRPRPAEAIASVDNVSPVTVLQAFLPQLDTGSDFPAFGAVTALTLGARSAAQASGSSEQNDGRAIIVDI